MTRVLFDAHQLGRRQTGNETYVRELLRGLQALATWIDRTLLKLGKSARRETLGWRDEGRSGQASTRMIAESWILL